MEISIWKKAKNYKSVSLASLVSFFLLNKQKKQTMYR